MNWLKQFFQKLFPRSEEKLCDRCGKNPATVRFEGRELCEECYLDIVSKRS